MITISKSNIINNDFILILQTSSKSSCFLYLFLLILCIEPSQDNSDAALLLCKEKHILIFYFLSQTYLSIFRQSVSFLNWCTRVKPFGFSLDFITSDISLILWYLNYIIGCIFLLKLVMFNCTVSLHYILMWSNNIVVTIVKFKGS